MRGDALTDMLAEFFRSSLGLVKSAEKFHSSAPLGAEVSCAHIKHSFSNVCLTNVTVAVLERMNLSAPLVS